MSLNLNLEQILVIATHFVVWLWYLPLIYAGLSHQEFRRLRQCRRYGAGTKPGYLAAGMSTSWALTRVLIWASTVILLVKNYLVSHQDWSIAMFFFLVPVMLGFEVYLWRRRLKYKRECERKYKKKVQESIGGASAA